MVGFVVWERSTSCSWMGADGWCGGWDVGLWGTVRACWVDESVDAFSEGGEGWFVGLWVLGGERRGGCFDCRY